MKPETSFLEIHGKTTQLTRAGEGPPLLYLHSASGETDWLPFQQSLAQRYHVHLPAHPGFALSAGLDSIQDMQDLTWHYVDLCQELGLKRLPVVGFSLGGWLGLELAILRPELVSHLVLIAAAGLRLPESPIAEIFQDNLDRLRELVFCDPQSPAASQFFPTSHDDPRMLLWLRAREATARVAWNPYLHNPKLPGHLRRVECPVLVIWGRQDRLIPWEHGHYYAQHLPAARLETLENCGHMVPLEMPERSAQLVLDFLAAEGGQWQAKA